MKIGIMAYRQFPFISANTAIAYIVGEEISKRHEIVYIGRKQDINQNDIHSYLDHKVVFLNEKPITDSARTIHFLTRVGLIRMAYHEDAVSLNKIVKNESIDALVCVIAPIDDAFIGMSARLDVPIYIYQLDPFYNSYDVENKQMKKVFIQYLKKTRHLFTTELLMDSYLSDPEFKCYLNKISVTQFPKLIQPEMHDTDNHNRTRLLYAGTLYEGRKPEYLIELAKCLPEDCDIVFCGKCVNEADEKKIRDSGILYKGYCSQDVLAGEFGTADILINIGNAVKNQLPSKVIDYLATGKPIINFSQIEECTSRQVLKDYKYFLNVDVQSIMQNRDLIQRFVLQCRNKRIPWSELQEQYKEYTPEYVSEHILNYIEGDYVRR